MSEVKLGKKIKKGKGQKDAIHIAVVPLIAGERLYKGHKIKLKFNTDNVALDASYDEENAFGIVDPFLDEYSVEAGQEFYGLVFPGTVTGMRHEWQHPKFGIAKRELDEHEAWIRDFCDRWKFDYDELISTALSKSDNSEYDRYIVAQGRDLLSREELGEDHNLFWEHLEGMMSQKFDEKHREGMGWSCTC